MSRPFTLHFTSEPDRWVVHNAWNKVWISERRRLSMNSFFKNLITTIYCLCKKLRKVQNTIFLLSEIITRMRLKESIFIVSKISMIFFFQCEFAKLSALKSFSERFACHNLLQSELQHPSNPLRIISTPQKKEKGSCLHHPLYPFGAPTIFRSCSLEPWAFVPPSWSLSWSRGRKLDKFSKQGVHQQHRAQPTSCAAAPGGGTAE